MIKVEPCRGCGQLLLWTKAANLGVLLEMSPLDGQGVVTAITSGREVFPAPDGKPLLVHRCSVNAQTALSRPSVTPEVPGHPKALPEPPAGRTAPSWVAPAEPARSADSRHRSDSPLGHVHVDCSTCGQPIDLADTGTDRKSTRLNSSH